MPVTRQDAFEAPPLRPLRYLSVWWDRLCSGPRIIRQTPNPTVACSDDADFSKSSHAPIPIGAPSPLRRSPAHNGLMYETMCPSSIRPQPTVKPMEGRCIDMSLATVRMLMVTAALTPAARPVQAQTPLESSSEARFQLDLHVSDQALTPLLPPGWSLNVATQGRRQRLQPARDFR